MKIKFLKNQQGSALIITLLVITVVSAIIFSTGRLALGELKLASQLEESDQAYYAAEGGIETGLLMFRFNHDVETSKGATKTEGKPIRFDLANNKVEKASVTTPSSEKSVFDLKGFYRTDQTFICVPEIACDEQGNIDPAYQYTYDPETDTPALAKDQTVEYDLSGVSGNNLRIEWGYDRLPTNDIEVSQTRLEYSAYNKEGKTIGKFTYNYDDYNKNRILRDFNDMPLNSSNTGKLRLKSWNADNGPYITVYKISGNSGDKLDSKLTTIESTGYFGGAKRKLQITVDRTTGTLLGLHDFALFGSSGVSGNP